MPSIINATTSNGLVTSADNSGSLQLQTNNGTTAVTIDTSQNVGIGTASPTTKLHITGNLTIENSSNAPFINFVESGDNTDVKARIEMDQVSGTAGNLLFYTEGSGTLSERMRIDSSGNLLVGATSVIYSAKQLNAFVGSTQNGIVLNETANTANTTYSAFLSAGSPIGSISRNGSTSSVSYNTTSDQRLKSNIEDADPVLNKLMDVKVRQYDWTEGDLHQDAGFIAQELAPVLSGIVTAGKTEEDMWQVDYSKLTPYLVKAIQELNAKVDAQALEIAALKGVA